MQELNRAETFIEGIFEKHLVFMEYYGNSIYLANPYHYGKFKHQNQYSYSLS